MSLQLLRSLPAAAAALRLKHASLPLLFLAVSKLRPLRKCTFSSSSVCASASETTLSISNPKYTAESPSLNSSSDSNALNWVRRTAYCGELSETDVGKRVRLCGWVALHRVHGGLTFLSLRDQSGIVQITTLPNEFPEAHSAVNDLRLEYVVAVEGVVRRRPTESINKKMKTGYVEVAAEHVQLLNTVKVKLPFLVTAADDARDSTKEEIRLRYRCLDLRRSHMHDNIMLRHSMVKLIRRYLEDVHGFVEVFTSVN